MNTTVAQTRALTGDELDLVSGGFVLTSKVGGFTFSYNWFLGETTVSAGDVSVTTGRGFVETSAPTKPGD